MTLALETRKGVVNDKPFWRVENKRKSDDSRLCEPFELWAYGLTSLDRCPQDISTAIQLQPVFAQWIQNTYALVHWRNDLQAPVRSI